MNNLHGILLMILANFLFALGDMFVKFASAALAPAHIIVVLGVGGLASFAALARVRGESLWHRAFFAPPVMARNLAEAIAAFGMITALALAPLSTVAAILQASPLVVTLLAALFLPERVGWRRWVAVIVGFGGVLLIVRPGAEGFDPTVLFAVLGMVGLSIRDFCTRIAPPGLPTTALASYGVASIIPMGIAIAVATGTPLPGSVPWLPVLGMVLFGTAAYFAITLSVRLGEVSVVAPFRYSRLVFAMLIGIAVFGERPDPPTLAGAALILGAGLYALWRERRGKSRLHLAGSAR